MNIRGIYKTSLIDYPGKISAVLFTGGCNLRCRYCHNPDLAGNWQEMAHSSNEDTIDLLRKRKNIIDGVTISGGEPTLSKNLFSFVEKVKELQLAVKLDSNGLQPEVLKNLISRNLIDYAAIDIKTSPEKYRIMTNSDVDFSRIAESITILRSSGVDYEVRTTCVPVYVTMGDLASIRDTIGRVKNYFLQQFQREARLLDRSWEVIEPYPAETLRQFRDFVLSFADRCEIRGL